MGDENEQELSGDELDNELLGEDTDEADIEESDTEASNDADDEVGESEGDEEGDEADAAPGDLRVALRQSRESERAARLRLAEIEYEVNRSRLAQQNQQRQEQYDEWFMQQMESLYTPEEQAEFIRVERDRIAREEEGRYQQAAIYDRLSMSAEYARQVLPDFDDLVGRAIASLGEGILERMSIKNAPENPAKWAYQYAKKNFSTPEERSKDAQSGLSKKQQAPNGANVKTIGHASASGGKTSGSKSYLEMSDAEFERSLRE